MDYRMVVEGGVEAPQAQVPAEVKIKVDRHGHSAEGSRLEQFRDEHRDVLAEDSEASEEVAFQVSAGGRKGIVTSIVDKSTGETREYLIPYTEIVNVGLRAWNADLMQGHDGG